MRGKGRENWSDDDGASEITKQLLIVSLTDFKPIVYHRHVSFFSRHRLSLVLFVRHLDTAE